MLAYRFKEFLLALFIILSISAQAQIKRIDTVDTRNINLATSQFKTQRLFLYTIGVKAYSLEEFPKILNQVKANDLVPTFMNGVFLKLNDNQISYRLGATSYSKDITFKNECEECEEAKGKLKDFSTRIGFEKNFIYGAFQPYLALDLGYRRNSFEGEVKNASTLNYTNPYDVNTLKNGFLISPNFGLKLSPVDNITIALETGIGLLYSYEKQERTAQDMSRKREESKFNKWEFLLSPVSMLSLQYNFGQTY
jgi:hypothetical protein